MYKTYTLSFDHYISVRTTYPSKFSPNNLFSPWGCTFTQYSPWLRLYMFLHTVENIWNNTSAKIVFDNNVIQPSCIRQNPTMLTYSANDTSETKLQTTVLLTNNKRVLQVVFAPCQSSVYMKLFQTSSINIVRLCVNLFLILNYGVYEGKTCCKIWTKIINLQNLFCKL